MLGALSNPNFLTVTNLMNVATRSAFIAIIAVGATFVISAGGLDLSVGAMVAFVASLMIMFINTGAIADPYLLIATAMALAIAIGIACGLLNGVIHHLWQHRTFIVTLGTMGIFRGLTTWLSQAARSRSGISTCSRPIARSIRHGGRHSRAGDRDRGDGADRGLRALPHPVWPPRYRGRLNEEVARYSAFRCAR